MAKDLKHLLAQKLAENSRRHAEAQQEVEFDFGRRHVKLEVDRLDPNPFQPRQVFSEAEIESLASSINETGLIQPIVVRPSAEGRYQIIAGERRWRAHQLLGRTTIEALINPVDDAEMGVIALAENLDREDLSDYEIGKALRAIEARFPSKKRLAEALGLNREDMYRYYAFEALPASIRARLEAQPRLLARAAASELKRLLQQTDEPERAGELLVKAWELLEAGRLEQGRIAAFVARELNRGTGETADDCADVRPLLRDGKKIGAIARDGRNVVVKVKLSALDAGREEKLFKFVEALLEDKV